MLYGLLILRHTQFVKLDSSGSMFKGWMLLELVDGSLEEFFHAIFEVKVVHSNFLGFTPLKTNMSHVP